MSNLPADKTDWTRNGAPKGVSRSHMKAWLDIVARLKDQEAKSKEATELMERYQAGMMLVGLDEDLEEACWKIKLAEEGKADQYETLKAEGKLDDTSSLKSVFRHLLNKKSIELATIKKQIEWLESGKEMLEKDEQLKAMFFKKDDGDNGGSSGAGGAGISL